MISISPPDRTMSIAWLAMNQIRERSGLERICPQQIGCTPEKKDAGRFLSRFFHLVGNA